MEVWGLFSIENNYDQPENNLEKLFKREPSLETIINFFYGDTTPISLTSVVDTDPKNLDPDQLNVMQAITDGGEGRVDNKDYRLELIQVEDNDQPH